MASNYPPGVTGNEFEIAGPDFEEERAEITCPNGHSPCLIQGYRFDRWAFCFNESCFYSQHDFTPPNMEDDWYERFY